jgi:hypothetical protein
MRQSTVYELLMGYNKVTDVGPDVTATASGTDHLVPPLVSINEISCCLHVFGHDNY